MIAQNFRWSIRYVMSRAVHELHEVGVFPKIWLWQEPNDSGSWRWAIAAYGSGSASACASDRARRYAIEHARDCGALVASAVVEVTS